VTHYTTGVDETVDALRDVIEANDQEWKIVADLEREEFEELSIEAIAPRNIRRDSLLAHHPPSAIFIDEIALMVPLGERYDHYAGLWLRGRHIGLSVYCATQRVSSVNKLTTSQAEVVALLGLAEPNDVDYLERRYGSESVARALAHTRSADFSPAVWVDGELALYPPEPA
jgi:DNA helicase HerA-like ATPase